MGLDVPSLHSALPLGIEDEHEFMDITLSGIVEPHDYIIQMNINDDLKMEPLHFEFNHH